MRSIVRQRQDVWFLAVEEDNDGIDKVKKFSKPLKANMTVSATSGTPEEITAGIVPNYDRYITSYDRILRLREGDMVYVDRIPDIDKNGALIMREDGLTPTVQPDYVIAKILDSQRNDVARYGIRKVDTSYEEDNDEFVSEIGAGCHC